MRPYAAFEKETDYHVPLLEVLADLPGHSGTVDNILRKFGRRCEAFIPARATGSLSSGHHWINQVQWSANRLHQLGLVDYPAHGVWRLTPQGAEWLMNHPLHTDLDGSELPSKAPDLSFTVRGIRFALTGQEVLDKARALIADGLPADASRPSGWAVDIDGVALSPEWLFRQVTGLTKGFDDRIPALVREFFKHGTGFRIVEAEVGDDEPPAPGLDLGTSMSFRVNGKRCSLSKEQVLETARDMIAKGLPREALRFNRWAVHIDATHVGLKWLFEYVTGVPNVNTYQARDIFRRLGLTAEQIPGQSKPSRSRKIPEAAETGEEGHWLQSTREEVRLIRDFLRGRGARPSDECLCDWVKFCYTLELYREASEVFALVDSAAVNPWFYERTKKLAKICRLKASS